MKAFRAMLTASVLMLARNRLLIITSLGLALISILVFGSLFGNNGTARLALGVVNEDDSPLAAQVVTQLRRLLLWTNLSVGTVLVGWRRQGIMRRLAATPLRSSVLVATQVLARLVISVAQAKVLLAVAILVFHVQIVGSWLLVGLTVALGALTMLGLGFVVGSFAPTQDSAQGIYLLLSFPMMFLSGSYFPTSSAPAFLVPVIRAMPLSYLNDALRQIMNNGATLAAIQSDLLVLVAWMVAALLLPTRAFRWT